MTLLSHFDPVEATHANTSRHTELAKDRHSTMLLPSHHRRLLPEFDEYFRNRNIREPGLCDSRLLQALFALKTSISDLTIDISCFGNLKTEETEQLVDVLWERTCPTLQRLALIGPILYFKRILASPPPKLPCLKEFILNGTNKSESVRLSDKEVNSFELLFYSFSSIIETLYIRL
jgi:hypothetical protein